METSQEVRTLDVREWMTGELMKRDERRMNGFGRRAVRYGGNDTLDVPVRDAFSLRYEMGSEANAADGYVLTAEVPAGCRVLIYGRFGNVSPGATLLAVFRGQEAIVTLQKDRGFRTPRTRNRAVRPKTARRVA